MFDMYGLHIYIGAAQEVERANQMVQYPACQTVLEEDTEHQIAPESCTISV